MAPECLKAIVGNNEVDSFIHWWSARVNGKVAENNWLASPPPPLAQAIAARDTITTANESARKFANQQIVSWMQFSCIHQKYKGSQFRNALLVPGSSSQTGQYAVVDGMLYVFPSHSAYLLSDYAIMINKAEKAKKLAFTDAAFKASTRAYYGDAKNSTIGKDEATSFFAKPFWQLR